MSQVDGYNSDIASDQVQKLAELFPEVVTEGKVNFEALRTILGEDIEYGEKYGLGWKGKSGVFAKIQEKTVSTLHPQAGESIDWDMTQNMFIEGDNLEALKVLHKAYYGKIKMIYIDPPYNTGNDFVYNDDFAKSRRQHAMDEGLLDEEGNLTRDDGLRINTGGHKHSNWLDMMYPRLFLARNLLRQDGVIFVSIDDNEVHNLRLMMNEIFGEENFLAQLVWQKIHSTKNDAKYFSDNHEYILCFARNINDATIKLLERTEAMDARYQNPDNDPRGPWQSGDLVASEPRKDGNYDVTSPSGNIFNVAANKHWVYARSTMMKMIEDNRVWFGKDGGSFPRKKRFLSEVQQGKRADTLLLSNVVGHNQEGKRELLNLFDGKAVFDTPKPVRIMKYLLKLTTNEDDIVLDFFGGSGSLAHAVAELNAEDGGNRNWLMVQLPELTDIKSEAYKNGYSTIAHIARERIRRAGKKIIKDFTGKTAERKTLLDLGFRSYILGESNFKKWNELMSDPGEIRQATLDQLNPIEDNASDDDLLAEILLKHGISPVVEMEKHEDFTFIPSEALVISLSRHMTEELFSKILAQNPSQIILLDQAFKDDVNLKTNLVLQADKNNINVEIL